MLALRAASSLAQAPRGASLDVGAAFVLARAYHKNVSRWSEDWVGLRRRGAPRSSGAAPALQEARGTTLAAAGVVPQPRGAGDGRGGSWRRRRRVAAWGLQASRPSRTTHRALLPLQQVVDHYENPRNVGSFDKKDPSVGTGLVGAPACGDVMKLQIKVGPVAALRCLLGALEILTSG